MKNRLIAIAGHKGAGKDTAAGVLTMQGYQNAKFAAPMKAMLATLLMARGVPQPEIYAMLEGDLKEKPHPKLNGRTPRHALQTIGTEWGRNLMAQTFWIDAFGDMVRASLGDATVPGLVVTDCRFHNEVAAIHDLGGIVIRVDRPGLVVDLNHQSEAEIPHLAVDHIVPNVGTISDLRQTVWDLLQ